MNDKHIKVLLIEDNPGDVRKNADIAMYRAKDRGRDDYQWFSNQSELHRKKGGTNNE